MFVGNQSVVGCCVVGCVVGSRQLISWLVVATVVVGCQPVVALVGCRPVVAVMVVGCSWLSVVAVMMVVAGGWRHIGVSGRII